MHKGNVNTCVLSIPHRTFHKEKHCDLKKNKKHSKWNKRQPTTQRHKDNLKLLNFSDKGIIYDMVAWYSMSLRVWKLCKTDTSTECLAFFLLMI